MKSVLAIAPHGRSKNGSDLSTRMPSAGQIASKTKPSIAANRCAVEVLATVGSGKAATNSVQIPAANNTTRPGTPIPGVKLAVSM